MARRSGLQRYQRLAERNGASGGIGETRYAADAFDVHPDRAHLGFSTSAPIRSSIVSTAWLPIEIMCVSGTERWLIVRSDESIPLCVMMAARSPAGAPVRERPQRHAIEVIDHSVAVGADDGHLARRLDERRFGSATAVAGLAEPAV